VSTLAVSDSCGAPVFSLRCLARIGSEPGGVSPEGLKEDIVRERHQLWVEAQHQRKRFCRYVLCTSNTKERLDAVVNEAHRAYVLSCDLLQELEAQPWSTFTYSKGPAFDARLAYSTSKPSLMSVQDQDSLGLQH
jgi:hypothetical protein